MPLSGEDLPKAGSRQWRRWCTRDPDSKASAPYLRNCRAAASHFLKRYFEAGPRARVADFHELLKEMHLLTVKNLTYVPTNPLNPQRTFPDSTRDELLRASAPPKRRAASVQCWLSPEIGGVFQRLIHSQGVFRDRVGYLMYGGNVYSFRTRTDGRYYRVPMNRLRASCHTRVQLHPLPNGNYACLVVRAPREIELMLKRASRLLARACALDPRRVRSSDRGRRELFKLLAQFHHLMIHTHPFVSQNNSVIMNQVNCVLFRYLGAFVPHGQLDLMALVTPIETYEKIFRNELEAGLRVVHKPRD